MTKDKNKTMNMNKKLRYDPLYDPDGYLTDGNANAVTSQNKK